MKDKNMLLMHQSNKYTQAPSSNSSRTPHSHPQKTQSYPFQPSNSFLLRSSSSSQSEVESVSQSATRSSPATWRLGNSMPDLSARCLKSVILSGTSFIAGTAIDGGRVGIASISAGLMATSSTTFSGSCSALTREKRKRRARVGGIEHSTSLGFGPAMRPLRFIHPSTSLGFRGVNGSVGAPGRMRLMSVSSRDAKKDVLPAILRWRLFLIFGANAVEGLTANAATCWMSWRMLICWILAGILEVESSLWMLKELELEMLEQWRAANGADRMVMVVRCAAFSRCSSLRYCCGQVF